MVAWAMAALIALTCLLAIVDTLLAGVILLLDLLAGGPIYPGSVTARRDGSQTINCSV